MHRYVLECFDKTQGGWYPVTAAYCTSRRAAIARLCNEVHWVRGQEHTQWRVRQHDLP